MTLDEAMAALEALHDERTHKRNTKLGVGENQFGAKLGDIKKLAKKIKSDHELGQALWATGNIDAQFLATLLVKPAQLSTVELDKMVRDMTFDRIADWFNSYVVKLHPDKEALREPWMSDPDPMAARAGWNLTAGRIVKQPEGLDLGALLDRLEAEMGDADPLAQWTMNFALVEIGIHSPKHRKRALAIGEQLGLYSDYPTAKGCTSPYAPIWINAMVERQG